MSDVAKFIRWAALARREPVPSLDVAVGVLARIRALDDASVVRRTNLAIALFSGVSAIAATLAAALAVRTWSVMSDPLARMFDSLTVVIQ